MTENMQKPQVSFHDIIQLGKKRVDDVTTVEVPALGGSVKLRQISGAQQDAAVAAGTSGDDFNQHIVAREQIKYSLVEPELPADEADAILDNLPVQAFGQLQTLVQANSGLLAAGVEQMVAMFRSASDASGANGNGSASDSGSPSDVAEGVGDADADTDDEAASVLPGDEPDAGTGIEAPAADRKAATKAEKVTA